MKYFMYHIILLASFYDSCFTYFSCNSHATILRQVEREGFHVDIHSLVELLVEVEDAALWENCTLLLREHIPESFFVNPDQLAELSRSGVLKACTLDRVDIEAPEYLSRKHSVYVYGRFRKSQNLIYSRLKLPVHLRYQLPRVGGGYASVFFKTPTLMIRCENMSECDHLMKSKAPCSDCSPELCNWMRISYKTNAVNFTLPVPVGNLEHLTLIKIVTYTLTFGGCFYVTLALLINKDKDNVIK